MKKEIIAYIDASNLRFGTLEDEWDLDYKAFRSWLRDKFGVPIINLRDFSHKLGKK